MLTLEEYLEQHPEWRPYADLVVVPPTSDEACEEFPDALGSEVVRDDTASSQFGVTRLALYVKLRRGGQTHKFAEMVAMQRAPRCMTDAVFFGGIPLLAEQTTPQHLKFLLACAKRQGFTPQADCVYQSGLARFPGDPEAWVSRAMGRTYIKRLCEQRGWSADGGVSVPRREPTSDPLAPAQCVLMAEDVIRANAARLLRRNPELKKLSKQQVRERVLAKYGPTN